MQEIYLDPQLETMPPPISSSSSGGGGGSSSRHNREIITTQRRDRNTNHPMDAILDDKFQISYRSAAIATYSEVVAIILLYGIAIYYFMVGFQFFGGGRIGGTSYFMNEILIVYRIIGGLLLGQSFSCSVLVSPIIQDLLDVRRKATTATRTTTNRNPIILLRKLSIHTSRACAVTTSITGLFLVVICLFEFYYTNSNGNQNNEMITDGMIEISETTSGYYEQSSHNNNNKISSHRISLQLLIYIGTGLIIFSCLSLMASFWPLLDEMDETQILLLQANSDASTATSTRRRRQQRSEPVVDDILSSDLQEPLLRDDHNYEMQQPNLNPVMISNCQNGDVAMQIDDDATVGISGPTGHNIETGIEENEDVAAILAEADAAAIELERSLLSHESMQMDDSEVGGDDDTLEQESSSRLRGTRRLLQLASTEVRYLYVGCAVLLVRLPFSLAMPHFVSTTLSALALNEFRKAREEISWLLLIGTIDAILDFWCVFLFGYANQRIVRELRLDLFNRLIRQEVAFFDKNGSGELTSRLNSDCSTMASDLTWFFRFSIESVVRITGIAAYMCIRCPTLGGCTLLIVPVIAIINKFYGDWLKDNAIAVQDSIAEVNSIAQETLSNIRTVLSFAAEDYESKRYQMKVQRMYRLNIRQLYITGVYYMVVSTFLINTIVQGSLLLIGSILIQRGLLTADVLLAFMLYQGQLQNETMNLFNSYSSLVKSSGAGDKVFALIDRQPPPPALCHLESETDRAGNTHRSTITFESTSTADHLISFPSETPAMYHIAMKGVSFAYPSRPNSLVLDNLVLDIPHGSTIALVGASGCGKTTIINLLQRFYDPTEGTITIDGVDLKSLDLKQHRRSIGVVTQDPVLFHGTIWDNITYGSEGGTRSTEADVIRAARLAHADGFVSQLPDGYHTNVGERGVQLSGGQKQRIAIARSIFQQRKILLLDEATSALDTESEIAVQQALDELLEQRNNDGRGGMTTVIIAHRLRTVQNADRILLLEHGKIVEQGTHEELMRMTDLVGASGLYRRMVERASYTGTLDD